MDRRSGELLFEEKQAEVEVASKSGPRVCVRARDSTEGMPGKLELGYAGAYDGAKENEPRVDLLGYVMGCVGQGGARRGGPQKWT